jgi:two-component system, NarL family, response regulator LiaR
MAFEAIHAQRAATHPQGPPDDRRCLVVPTERQRRKLRDVPAAGPVRVALVNDYEIVVRGLAAVLAPYADRIAVVEVDARRPVVSDVDVVLYDTFGQTQGEAMDLEALTVGSEARVVVFSWNVGRELIDQARHAGAAAYVAKSVSPDELVVVSPEGAEAETGRFGRWPGEEHGLSPRESEVLALICQGLSNEEITERAFIGINTVKTHIRTAYRKISVTTRSQAVRWGMEHGFAPDRLRERR